MQKAVFYHAGCPVCATAEQQLVKALDRSQYEVEVVHLGEQKDRIGEARAQGIESVPALVIGGQPLHINFGAKLSDLGA
jgi:glutaredoxin